MIVNNNIRHSNVEGAKWNTGEVLKSVKGPTKEKVGGVISNNVEGQNIPIDSNNDVSQSNKKNVVNFDVLDLKTTIDIYAEMQAVDQYDDMMKKAGEGGIFKKIGGFFQRSFYRMGRDAWIESKKRQIIKDINEGLKNGTYNAQNLEEHVRAGINGIEEKSYLDHEQLATDIQVSSNIQRVIDEWLDINPSDKNGRNLKIQELKQLLEKEYINQGLTTDLSQLESSLLKIEKAKIEGELKTIEAKLNVLDIGHIEYGYGDRKRSFVVNVLSKVEKSSAPKWFKGFIQHPNTAAVASAILARFGISLVAGGAALSFASGLLVPVAVGALAGGVLAYGRARREIKDRNAQIDRRGSLGVVMGAEATDGKSVNNLGKPNTYQHSVTDLYNKIAAGLNTSDEIARENALIAGASYLVKHKVGREKGLNMLQFDNAKSVSSQHVELISLLNKVFPGFVADFNKGVFFDQNNNSQEAQIVRGLYKDISNLSNNTLVNRDKEERNYGVKQGVIFGTVAGVVGGTASAVSNLIFDWYSPSGKTVTTSVPGTPYTTQVPTTTYVTSYPDNLTEYSSVKRDFWYDHKTPTLFEKTELLIRTDKSGGWNVSNLVGKTSFTNGHTLSTITSADFTNGNIQAVITPKAGGPSFVLPIDGKGNIQIPPSMQDAFNKRSFAFLEVGKVTFNGSGVNLTPIATVKGSGNMDFVKIEIPVPGFKEEIITPEPITVETFEPIGPNWYGVPFGWNRYHHLNRTEGKNTIDIVPEGTFFGKDDGNGDGVNEIIDKNIPEDAGVVPSVNEVDNIVNTPLITYNTEKKSEEGVKKGSELNKEETSIYLDSINQLYISLSKKMGGKFDILKDKTKRFYIDSDLINKNSIFREVGIKKDLERASIEKINLIGMILVQEEFDQANSGVLPALYQYFSSYIQNSSDKVSLLSKRQYPNTTNFDRAFVRELGEIMSLYILGREFAERYFDKLIKTKGESFTYVHKKNYMYLLDKIFEKYFK